MKKRNFLLFALILFLFLWAKITQAEERLTDRFKEAKLIEPGEYQGRELKAGEADYYKIKVNVGQHIQIKGQAQFGGGDKMNEFIFRLYHPEANVLSEQSAKPYQEVAGEPIGVFYLPGNTAKEDLLPPEFVYFEIAYPKQKEPERSFLKTYYFNYSLVEKTDVGLKTDAGDDFNLALEIKAGDYPKNFLAKNDCGGKYCSTDYKDIYKIKVAAKEKLEVKITPDSNLQPKIEFFNGQKEAEPGGKEATNKGAVVEAFYISPKDQEVYFAISDASLKDYFGSYAMNLSLSPATAEELKEAGIVEEEVPLLPEEEMAVPKEEVASKLPEIPKIAQTFISRLKQALIWLGVIVFIIVAVMVGILRARKKPRPPAPPAPPLPPKPSEKGTCGMILPPKELRGK